MNRRSILVTAAGTAAVLALTGCAGGSADGAASVDTINAQLVTDPGGFDPALARAADDYVVSRMLYDTLVRRDADNTLVGGIATDWEAVSASEYVFTIRDDATCAGGTAITPGIVADSLNRLADPELASTARSLAFGPNEAAFTADDDAGTVTAELSGPWSDFLYGMALPHTGIVCPAGLDDPEGLMAGTVEGAFSGPYTLTAAEPAVKYEMTLRDDYDAWPEFAEPLEGVPAKTVNFAPVAESSTLATQLLSGGMDVGTITGEEISRFTDDGYAKHELSTMTSYLVFNQREGSVFREQPELRHAAAQAVDPVAFTDIATAGLGVPIASVSAPGVLCVSEDESRLAGFDVDAASKTLAGVKIRLVGTTLLSQGNEYVAEMLRKAGAEVDYTEMDNANWSTTTGTNGPWDVTVQGDINLLGTMTSSLLRVMGPYSDEGGRNKTGVPNDEGYGLLNEAMTIVDAEAQCPVIDRAFQTVLDRSDAAPMASIVATAVAAPGFDVRVFGDYLDPSTMRITER
ncbi:ABC transporter substrate-binding protein [Agromyces archimandritae]|uniref:ABC transporter substrate-binding protein n=1 Tax=Agromyces archimandritae TaxID=2781962 RepID=A0A975FKN8_9MICO|nr:ABC transporter substrate-binding protein [Agromyces archimandritae]QTX03835.1 ABC transporter substrate-binding protein [Agromyces archimandritae]